MRGERDFEAYVDARGSAVLRCLLLLGLDLSDAEDSATAAFAALRSDWGEVVSSADPDVWLWSTVLSVESRRRRRTHAEPLGEAQLTRVLRESAALEELQVCEVLGISTSQVRAHATARLDHDADDESEAARPFPVPYARVRAAAGRQRRRRWLVTSGVAAATVFVVLVASWLSRPDPVEESGDLLAPAPAHQAANPLGVVWWADGELHLMTSVVRVSGVRRLVAAGSGAAYVDSEGRLVGVTADGGRTLLGLVADGSALVSSPRLGLVAWVDVSLPGATRLVVWDVEEEHEVAAVVTRPEVRPITFDGGWLRFGQGLSDWAWDPSGGPAQLTGDGFTEEPSDRTALVDAVASTRLEQWGTSLRVVRSGRRGEVTVSGFGGALSADGRYLLTGAEQHRRPRLHDARTGVQLDLWGESNDPLAAAFTGADDVAWLVERSWGGGGLELVVCSAAAPAVCSGAVTLGRPRRVVLAGDSRR